MVVGFAPESDNHSRQFLRCRCVGHRRARYFLIPTVVSFRGKFARPSQATRGGNESVDSSADRLTAPPNPLGLGRETWASPAAHGVKTGVDVADLSLERYAYGGGAGETRSNFEIENLARQADLAR